MRSRVSEKLSATWLNFRRTSSGNVVVAFALTIVPVMGTVGAAVDYSQSNSIRTAMQAAADSAALATVKTASQVIPTQIQTNATNQFNGTFSRPDVSPTVSASYDSPTNTVILTASATYKPNFMKLVGVSSMPITVRSKATMGSKKWQVCVVVTDPDSNHTLLVKNQSKIDFTNCMVQVNTLNWDAVEARDTSYIHSANGENCFVGEIHYGDVQPPKDPSCTFFPDPFASYTVPTNSCTYTNKVVSVSGMTLTPGTYCGGINISSSVTFSPGIYYIQNGDLTITSSANVTANNVTFLISGSSSNLNITTSGTLTMSPYMGSDAGQWAGFVFYYDQPSSQANKKSSKAGANFIKNATINLSGVVYLVGQTLNIQNGATVTVNPGSILADFILPDSGGTLNPTGTLNSSSAVMQSMIKGSQQPGASSGPILVQ